jgi:glyoxylase-like metal-dependent hydrolase (beta-lactamase superfamily II)
MNPQVTAFFDEATFTVTYLVADPATKRAAIIDPVLDFDPASGRTSRASADAVLAAVAARGLSVDWILETHVHADHLSAGEYLRDKLSARLAIGAEVKAVQKTFAAIFNAEASFSVEGAQFDHLFADDEAFTIGTITARALHTPGHTPACMTYVIGDAAFVGDTLFMPDYGTARTDFPGGDARTLYRSIRRIFALPAETRLFMCHDYKAPGRDVFRWETSVAEERRANIHAHDGVSEEAFVAMRTARDKTLAMPRLILPSVQINMRAGALPPAEANGVRYLKLPLDVF